MSLSFRGFLWNSPWISQRNEKIPFFKLLLNFFLNSVMWLSLLENVLKHFGYFQSLLDLQENSVNASSPFSYRKPLWDAVSFIFSQASFKTWTAGMNFLISIFCLYSSKDKSKHLAVWNRTVEQSWKWVCSYMQDWGDCKVRRVGLKAWTFSPFFYLYVRTHLFQRCNVEGCLTARLSMFVAPWIFLWAPMCMYSHRPCFHPGQKAGDPAHSRAALLQGKCMQKAKVVKGAAVKVKCKINQNTKQATKYFCKFSFFFS